MITVLAGGVGAAKFLEGLVRVVPQTEIVVVGNTGDDAAVHGLHVSPDLDTVTYTLAGASNREMGWGIAGDTFAAMGALDRYGSATWFRLGDLDLATHLYRTERLAAGASLSEVTAEITRAWGIALRLLPMSDDAVRTVLTLKSGEVVEFQEYFVHRRHSDPVRSVEFRGASTARPAPGVIDAVEGADVVLLAPSNPVLSLGPILAVEGLAEALQRRRERVVAVSPIVDGRALERAGRPLARGARSRGIGARCGAPARAGLGFLPPRCHRRAARTRHQGRGSACPCHRDGDGDAGHRRRSRETCPRFRRVAMTSSTLSVIPVEGLPEIAPGAQLGEVVAAIEDLRARDVVVVTQKIVSKAEGRIVAIDHDDADAKRRLAESEAARVLRRRGDLVVTETRHGFVCANSGVDLSNVEGDNAVLLPVDPDRSARKIREAVRVSRGIEIGVIVSDTFGRPWRRGLVDVAIGCAGIAAVVDLRGQVDGTGRELVATEMCVADEIAAAAELVMGKAAHVPVAIVRGVDGSWLRDSSVAEEIVRAYADDLFR